MRKEATLLDLQTNHAQEQYEEGLLKWPHSLTQAHTRSLQFAALKQELGNPTHEKELQKTFDVLAKEEVRLEPLLRSSTDVEKESYSQVCWTTTPWNALNAIPFALVILSLYKSYVVPFISLLVPILSWILPYVFLRTFTNIPMEFSEYSQLCWRMWNGQGIPRTREDLFRPPPPEEPRHILVQLKQWAQNGWTLFTIGQAMYEPVKQAAHFRTLDSDCLDLGKSVLRVRDIAASLLEKWKGWMAPWIPAWIEHCPLTDRQAFAHCLEFPFWLKHLFRGLGRFEVLVALANRKDSVPAQFIKGTTPILRLEGFGDPKIPVDRRVLSQLRLGGTKASAHVVLTGPNRGGKSSILRGIYQNVQYAHCFGCVFAEKGQMTYFKWIANALDLEDNPGEVSMFEREVQFASGIVKEETPGGLVLYDELFHSTNPPDATRASSLFCSKLWAKTNCISVISTHIYSLAREAPKQMCVAAWKLGTKYRFSYQLQAGICEVSSVDLLLRQQGLLGAATEETKIRASDQK